MISQIDDVLNYTTMYRLILYSLIVLIAIAIAESFFKLIPYSPVSIFVSTLFLVAICWIINTLVAKIFNVTTNVESVYITALILACITSPAISPQGFLFLLVFGTFAIISKYMVAPYKKHIFNPAAIGVFMTGILFHQYASWWIGNLPMVPFIILAGLLIVRKLRRSSMVLSFFVTVIASSFFFGLIDKSSFFSSFQTLILSTPIFFFAFIMFTEPLTTPPTKLLQIFYGVIVGILFAPQFHIGSFHSSLELSLLTGNIFSYLVSPRYKLFLHLREKIQVTPQIYNFTFDRPKNFSFIPGQYMEWTLSHPHADSRGNRRYFTIASSPTENTIALGVRIGDAKSSFKNALSNISQKDVITASSLAGDFRLPQDKKEKLVCIAGGIGITPFRSMIQSLIDKKQKRDIIIFYLANSSQDFAYKEIFDKAHKEIGLKIIYLTKRIDSETIQESISDFKERTYYLSGPNAMVKLYEKILKDLGIPGYKIKKDYFPGYA